MEQNIAFREQTKKNVEGERRIDQGEKNAEHKRRCSLQRIFRIVSRNQKQKQRVKGRGQKKQVQ